MDINHKNVVLGLVGAIAALLLAGCGSPVYTVDDGSKVDERLYKTVSAYGAGEQVIRPAIVRSATLKDPDCSKQWELPFAVATSYDLDKEKRIAWVRAWQVDERLSVIAATKESGLAVGDKIDRLDGYHRDNTVKMMERLIELREDGDPFPVTLSTGKVVQITPVEVCRGHVQITSPESPDAQDYHWRYSTHPVSVFEQPLTADEGLWLVLWTQGLSEVGGPLGKTYYYGGRLLKAIYTTASIVSGVGAVANAAQTAAAQIAAQQASRAAINEATQQAARALANQAVDAAKEKALVVLREALKSQAQAMAMDSIKASAIFRSSLSGVSWVMGTQWDRADEWALQRMRQLGADPMAAYSLHFKLASHANALNGLVFDEERLKGVQAFADKDGFGEKAKNVLAGNDPNATEVNVSAVTVASVESKTLEDVPPAPPVTVGSQDATVPPATVLVATPPDTVSAVAPVALAPVIGQ